MMHKDSYGFNTFAGLRISEIQKKTDLKSWKHIPSDHNIADILTKGSTPDRINLDSCWQRGPPWLVQDHSVWPVSEFSLNKEEDKNVTVLLQVSVR